MLNGFWNLCQDDAWMVHRCEKSSQKLEVLYKRPHLFVAFLFQNGADDVKKHRWFKTIDWEAVPQRKLKVRASLQKADWKSVQVTNWQIGYFCSSISGDCPVFSFVDSRVEQILDAASLPYRPISFCGRAAKPQNQFILTNLPMQSCKYLFFITRSTTHTSDKSPTFLNPLKPCCIVPHSLP